MKSGTSTVLTITVGQAGFVVTWSTSAFGGPYGLELRVVPIGCFLCSGGLRAASVAGAMPQARGAVI